ncbi:MAG: guanylate kinase [Verrucomicrobia bacterium]|nr:guanylate kinase [Verrucomicrobiota bacterium]
MTEKKQALLLVVSAPSGAGKSTLCNRLVEKFPGMTYSVSCTTRAPRGEEKNHEHYHFISRDEFYERVRNGEFLEHAEVHGNFYGTLKTTVQQALTEGRDLIMDIDVQGAAQIRKACEKLAPEDVLRKGFVDIFIAPPSMEELRRRLRGRSTDTDEVIEKRMRNAEEEMKERDAYQHLIINDDLDVALEKMVNMIRAERKKRR